MEEVMKKHVKVWVITLIFTILLSSMAQAAALGTRTLRIGTSGDDVTELQQLLKKIGYFNADPTGYFGSVTKTSVINFQSAYGLTKDGIAGTSTIHKLKYENGVATQSFVYTRLLKKGISGGDVQNLQEVLKRLGLLPASLKTTSYFGNQTEAAVKAFQKGASITADGIVVAATANSINNALSKLGNSNDGSTSNDIGQTYTVQPGDTLWVISQKYKVTVLQIEQANKLDSTNLLVGQKLMIPTTAVIPDRGNVDRDLVPTITYKNYTVKSGDSIWSIAYAHGILDSQLIKANGFTASTVLNVGQVIKIPVVQVPVKPTPGPQFGEYLDWWTEAQYVVPFNVPFTVTDFDTGTSFKAVRTTGANHADCEPLTAQDTATMLNLWNKYHTSYWTTRAVIITINDRRLAASMSAMLHAGLDKYPNGVNVDNRSGNYGYGINLDAIKGNNADGVFDIHFLNSTTHKDGTINAGHQASVRKAAGIK